MNYLVKRIYLGLVALLLTSVLVTTLLFIIPVDPARMSFGQMVDEETLQRTREEYGLDKPLAIQVWRYLRDLSPVSMGENPEKSSYTGLYFPLSKESGVWFKLPYLRKSYQSGERVSSVLSRAWPLTFALAGLSLLIGAVLGILLGVIAAQYYQTWLDKLLIGLSVLGYSVPSYVSALFFSLFFGYILHQWTGLPVQGSLRQFNALGESYLSWKHLILPALALGIRPIAVIMQITRASMIEVKEKNYITTAMSKGLSDQAVWWKHVFPNATNPVISTVTSWMAALLAGSFFVESIFNYHGIGLTTVEALIKFDIPLVLGCILSVGLLLIAINILTDLIYAWLDPRIDLE